MISRTGGERPRTSAYKSEILQSESLAEGSCPVSSKIDPFLGRLNSHISNDAYKLKVEKLKTDVLGRAGGVFFTIQKSRQDKIYCIRKPFTKFAKSEKQLLHSENNTIPSNPIKSSTYSTYSL